MALSWETGSTVEGDMETRTCTGRSVWAVACAALLLSVGITPSTGSAQFGIQQRIQEKRHKERMEELERERAEARREAEQERLAEQERREELNRKRRLCAETVKNDPALDFRLVQDFQNQLESAVKGSFREIERRSLDDTKKSREAPRLHRLKTVQEKAPEVCREVWNLDTSHVFVVARAVDERGDMVDVTSTFEAELQKQAELASRIAKLEAELAEQEALRQAAKQARMDAANAKLTKAAKRAGFKTWDGGLSEAVERLRQREATLAQVKKTVWWLDEYDADYELIQVLPGGKAVFSDGGDVTVMLTGIKSGGLLHGTSLRDLGFGWVAVKGLQNYRNAMGTQSQAIVTRPVRNMPDPGKVIEAVDAELAAK
ncbi:MAG: hypothetical protein AAGF92_14975 [Myxococcota bacterium]